LGVDHFARRRIGVTAIETEGHPAGLLAQRDASDLLGRRLRGIEDVDVAVCRVADPDLFLVGREANTVAGAAVPFNRTFLVAFDFDSIQLFAALQVPDLEAE